MVINKKQSRIYILCNSELAEPYYFQDFKAHLKVARSIIIPKRKEFLQKAPLDFIKAAISFKQEEESKRNFIKEDGDQIWCVLDVDNYWSENEKKFREALRLADENGLNVALSNECFEFWFLCHFGLHNSSITRADYHKKLAKNFRDKKLGKYQKNMPSIFNLLLPFQKQAIRNANKLYTKHIPPKNPSTGVVKLAEELWKQFE